jgi:hypothetical protein
VVEKMGKRADKLLREALRSVRNGNGDEKWDFDLHRDTPNANSQIGRRLDEAVDDMDIVDAVLSRYHYSVDPRHENQQEGDRWYIHENGHQVFLAPDPTMGVRWHHYEAHQKGAFRQDGSDHSFRKGGGAGTLENMLSTLHTKAVG